MEPAEKLVEIAQIETGESNPDVIRAKANYNWEIAGTVLNNPMTLNRRNTAVLHHNYGKFSVSGANLSPDEQRNIERLRESYDYVHGVGRNLVICTRPNYMS